MRGARLARRGRPQSWYRLGRLQRAEESDVGARVKTPLLLVNFKTYVQTRGPRAIQLAKAAARVARDESASIAIAPSALDLAHVLQVAEVPVFAQHIDPHLSGQRTGAVTADHVKELGAVGTLLNHSEKPLHPPLLAAARQLAKRASLITVICAGGVAKSRRVAALRPEFVAIEPPDLIGGDVSVSTARPYVVSDGVNAVRGVSPRTKVLCGAGVKTRADVERALELGTEGVLVASGVTLARDPRAALEDLARGLH